jgi:hypothetical protein
MINKTILFTIQTLHWLFLILTIVAVPFLLIKEPFYISLPLCAWIMHLGFSKVLDCPWTRLENHFRVKVNKEPIGGFLSHYIVKPIRRRKHK